MKLEFYRQICKKITEMPVFLKIRTVVAEFYIHDSVHRDSILIRSNEIQHMQVFIYCKITLHVLGVYRTHRQEYIKL